MKPIEMIPETPIWCHHACPSRLEYTTGSIHCIWSYAHPLEPRAQWVPSCLGSPSAPAMPPFPSPSSRAPPHPCSSPALHWSAPCPHRSGPDSAPSEKKKTRRRLESEPTKPNREAPTLVQTTISHTACPRTEPTRRTELKRATPSRGETIALSTTPSADPETETRSESTRRGGSRNERNRIAWTRSQSWPSRRAERASFGSSRVGSRKGNWKARVLEDWEGFSETTKWTERRRFEASVICWFWGLGFFRELLKKKKKKEINPRVSVRLWEWFNLILSEITVSTRIGSVFGVWPEMKAVRDVFSGFGFGFV